MIVIVDHVTLKDEGGKETVVKIAKGIEQDVKELLRCDLRNGGHLRLLMTLQYPWDNQ